MPEVMDISVMGGIAVTGVGLKLALVIVALVSITLLRKFFNGKEGVRNDWIVEAKGKGDFMPIAVYQCVMFAASCYLIGSVLS